MNIAITRFQIKPESLNQLKGYWESMLLEAKNQKGLKKALLITSQHGRCLAIGFWDSIDDAKAWGDHPAYKTWLNSFKELLVGPPERDIYTVASGDLSGILDVEKAA